ncbi:LysR substrate-binding domain-containing protein [Marinobacterium litorale]|uniref:LysR substrate-binding domain-containing protein n=1 Tax=Marinobacterium litorale TaxID=404770 RepID=UPI0004273C0B|nr:LysR substrate-binding domain-containing protein [Marinobacterium litorale]
MDWTRHTRLKHLPLLITLGETGSLSETARLTYTTQPSLSRWLKELEEDVGGELFERHARGLRPTALGQMLIAHARRIQTEVERAQKNIEAVHEGAAESVAIGTSPASAPSFVPSAITRFLERHPRSRVQVQESTMNTLLAKLKLGELDVVVGRLDNYRPSPEFRSEQLYSERIRVVSRLSHPLAQRGKVSWDDLYDYDWIVWPDRTPIRAKLDAALTRAGRKPPNYRVESTSQVGNLWLLQYTDMISVASERVAHHFNDRGLMESLDIDIDSDEGWVGMCWREDVQEEPTMMDLLDCMRESARFI